MTPSPVALFVYNRPLHAIRTLDALRRNELADQTELFIFSDGPRDSSQKSSVQEVRELIKAPQGFRRVTVIERETNLGLALSVIAGVTQIVNEYGHVIVMEDDLASSPYLLRFLNEGLRYYEREERVISIHGYMYPVEEELPETFFLRGADCWGWATWKRGWDLFEADGEELLFKLKRGRLITRFDLEGCYPFSKMLEDQVAGKNDSWAVRWHASAFIAEKLTLYPGRSLIYNIGLDGSGTHCNATGQYGGTLADRPVPVDRIEIMENKDAYESLRRFMARGRKGGMKSYIRDLIRMVRGKFHERSC